MSHTVSTRQDQSGGTALWEEVHPEKRDQLKAAMGGRMWGKLCSPTVLGRFTHENVGATLGKQ